MTDMPAHPHPQIESRTRRAIQRSCRAKQPLAGYQLENGRYGRTLNDAKVAFRSRTERLQRFLENPQPSLRGSIMLHGGPRLASWAKFSQACPNQL
jgi:hypothetical protein